MTRVRDLMSPDVQVVAETDSLTAAARLVRAHDVGSLPVCGQDGRLVGVLSQADLARHDDAAHVGVVVGEISEP
ncbi:CBS domain-containing protein [Salana multivorans]|uniref:CBS domain-containing protein n=1 Tax=Salana multivorans TaxID=120377 RepID=UPI000F4B331F|nr:CBS domain-containing protein [Salana multivorans]